MAETEREKKVLSSTPVYKALAVGCPACLASMLKFVTIWTYTLV